jgi:hypothetical protein
VEPPASTDVIVRVLGPTGSEVARADGGKAGQREEIAQLVVGRGEARFVVVSGNSLGDEPDGYILRWSSSVYLRPPAGPSKPAGEPPAEDPYEQK